VEFFSLGPRSARARLASDMVLAEDWAVIAGVQPIDLDNDRVPLPDGIEGQTRKVLANLERLLEAGGLRKSDIVQVRVALVDLARLYERMNLAYVESFAGERLPARSCIGVAALARGALVEMDFLVRRPAR
jgi:enamine deaminase RidA (YjgF/YER057c/UK114 family)